MKTERFRLRFIFWLDVNKPEENTLIGEIERLKQKRSFAKTIRDGIKLIASLREKRVDVLLKMFPFIDQHFQNKYLTEQQKQHEFMEKQISYLKGLLESGAISHNSGNGDNGNNAINPPLIPKVVDDEEIEIEVKELADKGNSSQNFLNSFMTYYGNSDKK